MVLEKAQELGLALCQSEEFANMQRTQVALESDEALCRTLQEFQQKQNELMSALQGDEGADRLLIAALSRDVESLQAQLLENPIFSAAMEAQNAFSALMQSVNTEIGRCIGIPAEEEHGCGGSCGSCGGCH